MSWPNYTQSDERITDNRPRNKYITSAEMPTHPLDTRPEAAWTRNPKLTFDERPIVLGVSSL